MKSWYTTFRIGFSRTKLIRSLTIMKFQVAIICKKT